jgi:hypothetical protein
MERDLHGDNSWQVADADGELRWRSDAGELTPAGA